MSSIVNELDIRKALIENAKYYIKKMPYRHYEGPHEHQDISKGMNCYGLFKEIGKKVSLYIPLGVGCWEMWEQLPLTYNPKPADLIFKNGRRDHKPGHMGIYESDKSIIHLSKSNGIVSQGTLDDFYPLMGFRSIDPYIKETIKNERTRIRADARLVV